MLRLSTSAAHGIPQCPLCIPHPLIPTTWQAQSGQGSSWHILVTCLVLRDSLTSACLLPSKSTFLLRPEGGPHGNFSTAAAPGCCRDTFLSRSEVGLLAAYMGDALDRVDLPPPALIKPLELWTGKQVFGLLLRPHAGARCVSVAWHGYSCGCGWGSRRSAARWCLVSLGCEAAWKV